MSNARKIYQSLAVTGLLASFLAGPVPTLARSPIIIAQTIEEDWAFANRLYNQHDIYNAFSVLNALIKRNPKFAPAHDLRGAVLLQMGNPQGAYDSLTQAIELDTKLASAYGHRGQVLASLGDPTGAIADFDQALQLDPSLDFAYFERANTHISLGNSQKAIADYSQAIKYNPNLAPAYTNRGRGF